MKTAIETLDELINQAENKIENSGTLLPYWQVIFTENYRTPNYAEHLRNIIESPEEEIAEWAQEKLAKEAWELEAKRRYGLKI